MGSRTACRGRGRGRHNLSSLGGAAGEGSVHQRMAIWWGEADLDRLDRASPPDLWLRCSLFACHARRDMRQPGRCRSSCRDIGSLSSHRIYRCGGPPKPRPGAISAARAVGAGVSWPASNPAGQTAFPSSPTPARWARLRGFDCRIPLSLPESAGAQDAVGSSFHEIPMFGLAPSFVSSQLCIRDTGNKHPPPSPIFEDIWAEILRSPSDRRARGRGEGASTRTPPHETPKGYAERNWFTFPTARSARSGRLGECSAPSRNHRDGPCRARTPQQTERLRHLFHNAPAHGG